jgi:acyl carrier protein
MRREDVRTAIKEFIETQVLASSDVALEPDTPLLEWGILNSLSTSRMLAFVRERFGVIVPADRIVGAHLKDLDSISALVVELSHDPGARVEDEHSGVRHG